MLRRVLAVQYFAEVLSVCFAIIIENRIMSVMRRDRKAPVNM